MWQTAQAFNEQSVEEICQNYRGEFDQRRLQAQLLCLPNLRPTTSAPEVNVEFHDIVAAVGESQMNAMIPDVMQLLTFYSVCPASTATSAERSFSHLRCIKSYLRNTMSQQRLVSLMLLFAYPEMVDNLNIDKLMDAFIIRNDARRK